MKSLGRKAAPALAAAGVGAIFFAWLAMAVNNGELAGFDLVVRNTVHSWASPLLTRAMRGITQLGSWPVLVGLGLAAAWALARRGRKRAGSILVLSALGAQGFDQVLKNIFRRPRPDAFFGHSPGSFSFPSGHSVESCCFYGVLAAIVAVNLRSHARRIAIWAVASTVTLLVGTSRIYLGVHYPTDVIGGYAAAVVWVSLVWLGYQWWLRRRGAPREERRAVEERK